MKHPVIVGAWPPLSFWGGGFASGVPLDPALASKSVAMGLHERLAGTLHSQHVEIVSDDQVDLGVGPVRAGGVNVAHGIMNNAAAALV